MSKTRSMSDGEEVVGSDFIGPDDDDESNEVLEQKLLKILEEKERLERKKKRDELLERIRQAESEVSNLQTLKSKKSEVDKWSSEDLKQFFKRKGIVFWHKPVEQLRILARSLCAANIPDHQIKILSQNERLTIQDSTGTNTFPSFNSISPSEWSEDMASCPSLDHMHAHAYMLSSAEFDLDRLKNMKRENGFTMFKSNSIKNLKFHKLDQGYNYIKGNCFLTTNNRKNVETVWSLIQDGGEIHSSGCSCTKDTGYCDHVIAMLLTVAAVNTANTSSIEKRQCVRKDQASQTVNLELVSSPAVDTNALRTDKVPARQQLYFENYADRGTVNMTQTDSYAEKKNVNYDADIPDEEPEVWVPPSFLKSGNSKDSENSGPSRLFEKVSKTCAETKTTVIDNQSKLKDYVTKTRENSEIPSKDKKADDNSIDISFSPFIIDDDMTTWMKTNKAPKELHTQTALNKIPSTNTPESGYLSGDKTLVQPKISTGNSTRQLNTKIEENLREMQISGARVLSGQRSSLSSRMSEKFEKDTEENKTGTGTSIPSYRIESERSDKFAVATSSPKRDSTVSQIDPDCITSESYFKDSKPQITKLKPKIESTFNASNEHSSSTKLNVQPRKLETDILPEAKKIITVAQQYIGYPDDKPSVQHVGMAKPTTLVKPMQNLHTKYQQQFATDGTQQTPLSTTSQNPYMRQQNNRLASFYQQQQANISPMSPSNKQHHSNISSPLQPESASSLYMQHAQQVYPNIPVISYPHSKEDKGTPVYGQKPNNNLFGGLSCDPPMSRGMHNTYGQGNNIYLSYADSELVYPSATASTSGFRNKMDTKVSESTLSDRASSLKKENVKTDLDDDNRSTRKENFDRVQDVEPMHIDDSVTYPKISTNPTKTKASRKDRFGKSPSMQVEEDTSDLNFGAAKKMSERTQLHRISYDRKTLLRLQKSVFSKRRPDIDHIPEIIDAGDEDILVRDGSFRLTQGYVIVPKPKAAKPREKKTDQRTVPRPGRDPSTDRRKHVHDIPQAIDTVQTDMSTEDIMRKAIGAFNMLKHGCEIETVVKAISELPITNEDTLSRIVNLLIETVIESPGLISVCSNICRILSRAKVPSRDTNEIITFSAVYKEKCLKEIDLGLLSHSTEDYKSRLEEIARFTGCISRLMLLKNCDIHTILMKMAEKCLECFCTLLGEVWDRMEKSTSPRYVDQYLEIIDEALEYKNPHTNLGYKLLQLKTKQKRY